MCKKKLKFSLVNEASSNDDLHIHCLEKQYSAEKLMQCFANLISWQVTPLLLNTCKKTHGSSVSSPFYEHFPIYEEIGIHQPTSKDVNNFAI